MFKVQELRPFARANSREQFLLQVGPFVLIQRPPEPLLAQAALKMAATRTVAMIHRNRLVDEISVMLSQFAELSVATLPPMRAEDQLSVGRLPDCDLVIDDPSVSKRHATVRWDGTTGGCSVQDLGSTNGTFVNAEPIHDHERILANGDVVSFGDTQFLYLLGDALHAHLLVNSR